VSRPNNKDTFCLEGGFTLLEMLIVMAVMMVMASVTAVYIGPIKQNIEAEEFILKLETDLLYAQQYAISHQHEVYVNIMAEKNYYYIRERDSYPLLAERTYSEDIIITGAPSLLYFKYTPDGNISKFGSFYITVGKERYRFTISIGKGRFYVSKE